MRVIFLPLLVLGPLLGLAACSEKDRLMGKAWTCLPTEEMHLSIKFLNDSKLEAKLALADPKSEAQKNPQKPPLSIKMNLGGQWVQPEEGRMDFAFRSATVTEAKRGDQPMSNADVFFYKDMFETSPKTSTKIVELSGAKFTYQELSSDKTVTCTR
jgi:hypothetical protein